MDHLSNFLINIFQVIIRDLLIKLNIYNTDMDTKNSINESLEIIRKALEDEKTEINKDLSSNILVLNQKVNSDGTIKLLHKDEEINKEINDIIDQKLSYLIESKIENILDQKIPKLLKNYFDSK